MPKLTLADLSEKMRDIDFTMLTTRTEDGSLASRPMSNNGEVEFKGDAYFFSYDSARTISDIERDPNVGMTLTGSKSLVGKPPIFIAAEGRAELIRDKEAFREHWVPDLERWFEQGVDTPGLVLIKVHVDHLHYWDGEDEGEIDV